MRQQWNSPAVRFLCFLCFLLWTASASGTRAAEGRPGSRVAVEQAIAWEPAGKVIDGLTHTLQVFGRWVDQCGADLGSGALAEPWFGGLSGARILASGILLGLVALLSWWMVSGIRKYAGRIRKDGDMTWPRLLLSAVRKPLALILWIYAAYFAIGIHLDAAESGGGTPSRAHVLSGFVYVGLTVAAFWLLFRLIRGVQRKMLTWADGTESVVDNVMVPLVGTSLRLLIPLFCLFVLRGAVELPEAVDVIGSKLLAIFLIASIAFLIIRGAGLTQDALMKVNRIDVADNLRAREIYTQVSVIRKIIVVSTLFLAVACTLMLFQPVRQFGTSLLASAGIAGVVLGLAAQKTLSNLLAGIQIAFSQPIRIDDVVIVEGEWGRIENITLTFVTVNIWDQRRLVLPIQYFIEKPFQNWTRSTSQLLNSVFLHVDYRLPVEPLRAELKRLLDANPLWDQRAWVLQVTEMTPKTMEIRCLMSSSDASKGWDLKCEIREGLVKFIQENHPECLPLIRADLQGNEAITEVS